MKCSGSEMSAHNFSCTHLTIKIITGIFHSLSNHFRIGIANLAFMGNRISLCKPILFRRIGFEPFIERNQRVVDDGQFSADTETETVKFRLTLVEKIPVFPIVGISPDRICKIEIRIIAVTVRRCAADRLFSNGKIF